MPRRQTSSAAGVLAALLLAALPASAQDAPGLRGSLGGQQPAIGTTGIGATGTGNPLNPIPGTAPTGQGNFQLRGGIVGESPQGDPTNDLSEQPSGAPSLGGLGDGTTSSSGLESEDTTAVSQLRRSTVDPGLRGTVTEDEAVEGFGIDQGQALPPGEEDPFGEPLETPLRPDIVSLDPEDEPLGLRARQLDPFIPLGTRIGNFLIFAEAEIGGVFTDNVLGTPNGISDYAFEFAPEVRLESDWERHAFEAEFTADRTWFNRFSVEDDQIYAALLRGRLDVGARTSLELEVGKAQTQDGRNASSITNIAGFQTNVQEEQISATVQHNFNRLTVEVEGSASRFDYEDLTGSQQQIATVVGGLALPLIDIRDFRENEITMRGTYEFNPDLAVYVEGELSEEIYRQPVTASGINRDSSGYAVLTGVTYALSDAFYGDISLGWGEQTSVDADTAPVEGFLFDADIVWMPTPMTLVEFIASTSISTSNTVDSLGAVTQSYRLSLQQAFWRYFVVGGFVSYESADYVDNTLREERIREGLTLEYYFNQYMSFYTDYEHTDFISTDRLSEFTENRVRIGMRIRN